MIFQFKKKKRSCVDFESLSPLEVSVDSVKRVAVAVRVVELHTAGEA